MTLNIGLHVSNAFLMTKLSHCLKLPCHNVPTYLNSYMFFFSRYDLIELIHY